MTDLSKAQVVRREKTLLTALLLSTPGVVVTGFAVASSHSTTQLADFIRRSAELLAMFLSWWVFCQLQRKPGEPDRARLERLAGLGVAGALICSGVVMLIIALSRLPVFQPSGKVTLGLTIATLGLLINSWFWWRYTSLAREQYSPVIAAQQQLYRAKVYMDLCVVVALAAVAVAPAHPATRYMDILGSIIVSGYLLLSGARSMQAHLAQRESALQEEL